MKSKSFLFAALAVVGMATPSFADGGPLGTGASLLGTGAAFLIDVPEGIVVDSLVKCPYKASKGLAEAFGDENGWKQNIVGTIIGVPTGFAFGIPYGAIAGGHHAFSVGWEKPFSAESFVVSNEGK